MKAADKPVYGVDLSPRMGTDVVARNASSRSRPIPRSPPRPRRSRGSPLAFTRLHKRQGFLNETERRSPFVQGKTRTLDLRSACFFRSATSHWRSDLGHLTGALLEAEVTQQLRGIQKEEHSLRNTYILPPPPLSTQPIHLTFMTQSQA